MFWVLRVHTTLAGQIYNRGTVITVCFFFFSSRRRHTRLQGDWSSDVCSSDLTFAAADPAPDSNDPSKREITRIRRNLPGTVPNDPDALTALNEGEKQIAEKNPRAAEAAFQKVLGRYPEQARARYGLGLVAMLEGDPTKAQEVFGRLVNGEHAATNDPMVLAWSHVYLGRIYEGNGQRDRAKQEFQAALDVPNGPETARLAGQRGLQAPGGSRKASEHP